MGVYEIGRKTRAKNGIPEIELRAFFGEKKVALLRSCGPSIMRK